MKRSLFLIPLFLFAVASLAVAQEFNVIEREKQISLVQEEDGSTTFVITSSNPEAATRIFNIATQVQRMGQPTSVLYEAQGIALAVDPKHITPLRRAGKGDPYPIRGQMESIDQRRLQLAADEYMREGGKVEACPICMKQHDISHTVLRKGVTEAPINMVKAIHARSKRRIKIRR